MKIVPEIVLFIGELSKARRGQQVIIQVIRRGGAPSGAEAVIARGMEGFSNQTAGNVNFEVLGF